MAQPVKYSPRKQENEQVQIPRTHKSAGQVWWATWNPSTWEVETGYPARLAESASSCFTREALTQHTGWRAIGQDSQCVHSGVYVQGDVHMYTFEHARVHASVCVHTHTHHLKKILFLFSLLLPFHFKCLCLPETAPCGVAETVLELSTSPPSFHTGIGGVVLHLAPVA